MAGNTISLIGISTKGKGGRVSEMLPRFARSSFTIPEKQNAHFRCAKCGTILPNFGYTKLKQENRCPLCGAKDSIVSILRQKPVHKKVFNSTCKLQEVYDKIQEIVKNNDNLTTKEIANLMQLPYMKVFYYLKRLGLKVKAGKRGRKPQTDF